MPFNTGSLSPELLRQLQELSRPMSGSGSMFTQPNHVTVDGINYQMLGDGGNGGIMGWNPNTIAPGAEHAVYNQDGSFDRMHTGASLDSPLVPLAAMGLMAAFLPGGFMAGGGAGAGAVTPDLTSWAMESGAGGLSNGLQMMQPLPSVTPMLEALPASMGTPMSIGGAAAAGGAAGAGFAGDATAAGYGGLDAASAATMGGGASVNGGSSISRGLLDTAMKYGPGLLGAIAGSQQPQQNGRRGWDDRLDPYIFGDQGALKLAQGLLSRPVAENGFSRFYGG
jgi:hypothetical protein